MINLLRMCCQRGLTQFDLGVGEASFKRLFCREIEPLFDTFRPLTARGAIVALGYRLAYHLKSKIKHSPTIWGALTTVPVDQSRCAAPAAATATVDLKLQRRAHLSECR